MNRPYNVVLDGGGWLPAQKRLLALAMLVVLLDGFDTQLFGIALPALLKSWRIDREAMAPVLAASTLASICGALASGMFNNRLGRQRSLLLNLIVLVVGNGWSAAAQGLPELAGARAIAGFGLGGVLVCIAALVAEFTPSRHRAMALAMCGLCMPLGGACAGIAAEIVMGAEDAWRPLFVTGAIFPLAAIPICWLYLPESPLFLSARPEGKARLQRALAQIGLPGDATFAPPEGKPRGSFRQFADLLDREWRRDTVLVWIGYFCCILGIFANISWLPTLFVQQGHTLGEGARALAASSVGAMVGSILSALLIRNFGSRFPLTFFPALAILLALAMFGMFRTGASIAMLTLGVTALSFAMSVCQTSFYALIGSMYDDRRRIIGASSAYAFGRVGSLASAFAAAAVLGFGASGFYLMFVSLWLAILIAMLLFGRHAQPVRQD